MNDFYDDSAEDASAIVALLDANADEVELLDAWFDWATTDEDDHVEVVERLYRSVGRDFRETIFLFVEVWASEFAKDGWEEHENTWLQLIKRLNGLTD